MSSLQTSAPSFPSETRSKELATATVSSFRTLALSSPNLSYHSNRKRKTPQLSSWGWRQIKLRSFEQQQSRLQLKNSGETWLASSLRTTSPSSLPLAEDTVAIASCEATVITSSKPLDAPVVQALRHARTATSACGATRRTSSRCATRPSHECGRRSSALPSWSRRSPCRTPRR